MDVDTFLAPLEEVSSRAKLTLRPPPRLSLSEWATQYYVLSTENASEPGRFKPYAYQRDLLDAMSDPSVWAVSVQKSARVGYTLCLGALVGYHIHQDPANVLIVQPTLDGARGFSKDTLTPLFRDCAVLTPLIYESSDETDATGGQTLLQKNFKGGVLSLAGATSPNGFRRVSRRVVLFDEVDSYPASAGEDGDPVALGTKRSATYWNRKRICGSTPLVSGFSRIEQLFREGDRRYFHVPCPHCGHRAKLVFSGADGHAMKWPDGKPEEAFFACQLNGCVIEQSEKDAMMNSGEWVATNPDAARDASGRAHASFHIWAAMGSGPACAWGQIAKEFLDAKERPDQLRTFVNTVLGETWQSAGDAPDWDLIYRRREQYPIGVVPEGAKFLTAGMDVQKDRVVWEVVGWGLNRENWSVDSGVLPMDTSNEAEWIKVDTVLDRAYDSASGSVFSIRLLAIDAGYNTQMVYNYARTRVGRVIAVKGVSTARTLIGMPTPVDVTVRGKRIARGCKVWPVGVDIAKSEFYGWLRLLTPEDGAPFPGGFCHFPEYDPEFFKQITSEQLVSTTDRRGYTKREWQQISNRENHALDARIYARAAAAQLGVDRVTHRPPPVANAGGKPPVGAEVSPRAPRPQRQKSDSGFLSGRGKRGNWLG